MKDPELQTLISQIQKRFDELGDKHSKRKQFIDHLRSLGSWDQDLMDYPSVTPDFPEQIKVAYAVCHPECGVQELIVDGSTQECQRCGQLMFRAGVQEYSRKI
jgi:hypothetical protein